jgi:hypothetical protein
MVTAGILQSAPITALFPKSLSAYSQSDQNEENPFYDEYAAD